MISGSPFSTEYGIPVRNLWHMLVYAWNEVPLGLDWSFKEAEAAPTLQALLASILARLARQRLRIGLGRSYTRTSQVVQGIRGRVDFAASLREHCFEQGQAHCVFETFHANTLPNQILRSTLLRLVQTGDFGPATVRSEALRHELRSLTRALEGVDLIELSAELIRRQGPQPHDRDYRLMLAICELLARQQMPLDQAGRQALPDLAPETLVLYEVFERFVANFYRLHLEEYRVRIQSRLSWHARHDHAYLPTMQPDLILQEQTTGRLLVLDTKFTAQSLVENAWGQRVFDSAHLYQLYAYLSSQAHLSSHHQQAIGILLYPAVRGQLSETVELRDHVIRLETVDLTAPWPAIEARLLTLIRSG